MAYKENLKSWKYIHALISIIILCIWLKIAYNNPLLSLTVFMVYVIYSLTINVCSIRKCTEIDKLKDKENVNEQTNLQTEVPTDLQTEDNNKKKILNKIVSTTYADGYRNNNIEPDYYELIDHSDCSN